jgi:hypothetical protein
MRAAAKQYWDGYTGAADAYVKKVFGERDPLARDFQLFEGDAPTPPLPPFEELAERVFGPMRRHAEVVQ